ncbi:hypothetical protein EMG21_29325 [Klebsiella pneumoniae]|nr:hypothetical protein EMG21_29325 [Klebsiella pneumoniae]
MPRGGARSVSGPPPDPNALRRDRPADAAGWTTLPADGRTGDPPEWPLLWQTQREHDLWKREWRRPQAVMWEAYGQQVEVAMYVRLMAVVEDPDNKANTSERQKLFRQYLDSLGLSVQGMLRNRWRIEPPESSTMDSDRGSTPQRRPARERFKVVLGGE